MLKLLKTGAQLIQRLGPRWAASRARHAVLKKPGQPKRRFPTKKWSRVGLVDLLKDGFPSSPVAYKEFRRVQSRRFFFAPGEIHERNLFDHVISPAARTRTIAVADDYCRGRFLYFSSQAHDLGWPPDWLLNPYNGERHHTNQHWCDYPTFSKELGDIKDVWEPSRFACAFWLARAYVITRADKYPESFWTLFESWAAQNPPNMGPNWKCGQETAIRLLGWCFGLWAFWNSPSTTPERVAAMSRLIAVQAERIYHNIDYAISQKNNHSISEATGLLTVGLLFSELKESAKWLSRGREVLEADARRQIYDDGSFVQHSMNYHRVMLHDFLWAIRLADLNGQPLSDELKRRVQLAGDFLFEMMDESSGRVPNYGPNDGALVLPLDAESYDDYRPTAQAASFLSHGQRILPDGPWNEPLLWLFGRSSLEGPANLKKPVSRRFDDGGYYTIRGGDSWAMIRCHSYRDRPTHVDMLHLDLWHRGENVLSDSGTYKYYAPESPGAEKYFKDIASHNTVEIDGRSPLDLVARFMWMPWPVALTLDHARERFVGEHYAYHRSPWHVTHRRTVELNDNGWIVTDDILGEGRHDVKLRWHHASGLSHSHGALLSVEGPDGLRTETFYGDDDRGMPVGWESRRYGERSARRVLIASGQFTLPIRLITRISFSDRA